MPPAAPVPTTAPPTSKNSVVRNPPPLGGGGTFRTVSVIDDVPETVPLVAVIVIVYGVSASTCGADTATCRWPVASKVNVDGVSGIVGEGARFTFAPAAGKPSWSDTVTSIAPAPPSLITFPNGVSASNVRNFAPGGNVVMTTVTRRAAPNEELVDWISRNVDTGVALVLSVGAMKVAANCPFAFVVPVDGLTVPAPDVRVMLMDAPSTGVPFESRTVTVIGALPPEPTADGMLAADRITPGGAGSSKIRDQ